MSCLTAERELFVWVSGRPADLLADLRLGCSGPIERLFIDFAIRAERDGDHEAALEDIENARMLRETLGRRVGVIR
jgi:hypothetical protein